jgi:hypothetical protein
MCCLFTSLVVLGPRFAGAIWWLVNPALWNRAFSSWIWPLLGLIFLPWTTLMYVIVFPGGIVGLDWLWMALAVVADIMWYTGAAARKRVPGYSGTY